jgi:hypothetical protein
MKKHFFNYLENSIIKQAIELGCDFSDFNDFDYSLNDFLVEFFIENSEKLNQLYDKCDVLTYGNSQSVTYKDYTCSGQIVDFSQHWADEPGTKVYHSQFLILDDDGLIKQMNLYYVVPQTIYN